MLERELRSAGAPAAALSRHDDELAAVRAALEWARPGDVVVLTVHAERDAVIELVERKAVAARRAD
jgi:hypothetical protein